MNIPRFALSSDISLATTSNFSPSRSRLSASSLLLSFSHCIGCKVKKKKVKCVSYSDVPTFFGFSIVLYRFFFTFFLAMLVVVEGAPRDLQEYAGR